MLMTRTINTLFARMEEHVKDLATVRIGDDLVEITTSDDIDINRRMLDLAALRRDLELFITMAADAVVMLEDVAAVEVPPTPSTPNPASVSAEGDGKVGQYL